MKKATILILSTTLLLTGNIEAQLRTLTGQRISEESFTRMITKTMDSLAMPAISIALMNGDNIIYHNTFGVVNTNTKVKADEQSVFEAASMSKTVFAYLVMRMVDEGKLNLDTPLCRYMPYPDIANDERYELITARMVIIPQASRIGAGSTGRIPACMSAGLRSISHSHREVNTAIQEKRLYILLRSLLFSMDEHLQHLDRFTKRKLPSRSE